jgi:hypothetical protein
MDLNNIPICISGIDYQVDSSFFTKFKVVEERLITDTYFIKGEDSTGFFSLSVHKNFYDLVKRDSKISKILE